MKRIVVKIGFGILIAWCTLQVSVQASNSQPQISASDAILQAQRLLPKSKILGVRKREGRGRFFYRVKVLSPKGQVLFLRVDGRTGEIVRP